MRTWRNWQIYPALILPEWRNWNTRMFQEHIPHWLWVRIPPRAQVKQSKTKLVRDALVHPVRYFIQRGKGACGGNFMWVQLPPSAQQKGFIGPFDPMAGRMAGQVLGGSDDSPASDTLK